MTAVRYRSWKAAAIVLGGVFACAAGAAEYGYRSDVGHERPPAPNLAFWLLLLLPPEQFAGEYFFTGATTHRTAATTPSSSAGRIPAPSDIAYTPREIGRAGTGRLAEIVPRSAQ